MKLVEFLNWNCKNGVYKSEVDGEIYRIVDGILEMYEPDSLEWERCNMPINKYTTLQAVKQVGEWIAGFEIYNEVNWQLVKTFYSQNGYGMPKDIVFTADRYVENRVVFYIWLEDGKIQMTTNKRWANKNLALRSIIRK